VTHPRGTNKWRHRSGARDTDLRRAPLSAEPASLETGCMSAFGGKADIPSCDANQSGHSVRL
jgi:hypothetical protein